MQNGGSLVGGDRNSNLLNFIFAVLGSNCVNSADVAISSRNGDDFSIFEGLDS